MYQSILVAIDGSENAERAGKQAAQLATLVKGTEVTIVYVSDFDEDSNEKVHDGGQLEFELSRKKKIQPIKEALERGEVFYKIEMMHGRPAPVIIEMANEGEFDLVVIGSRGLKPVSALVLGSVSQKVVNHVHCPVLVVK
ncbi:MULTISPECIES: universal stress protein [Planococcus]|uniref:Universal stress protein n=2 Tax=Planococcus TaxID=1372 RepID=A0ABM5WXK7_9BACL|nr:MULTISPECIES: universal stress protein [Planococcus]ALS79085.1 universal stress protein [Planococcus kocurii]AQU78957.1 universal stress protein [Planococcus faecalis]KAA0957950.1 universal stress protein [Planococcus sp. ANT_H30]MDJ0330895.1 universal stress protein [Planococcus sp. S3-L1]OHX54756.1 universal stress protein [Planococcus faecalis]